jgi:hypothetical protein
MANYKTSKRLGREIMKEEEQRNRWIEQLKKLLNRQTLQTSHQLIVSYLSTATYSSRKRSEEPANSLIAT